MSLFTNAYKIHSVEFVLDGNTPMDVGDDNVTVGALTSVSFPTNANVKKSFSGASNYPSAGYIDFATSDLSFTTVAPEGLISTLGDTGICFGTGESIIEVCLYARKYGCTAPSDGAVNYRITIEKGFAFINSLSCDHQGELQVSATVKALTDGTNEPATWTSVSAVPDTTQLTDENERWTLDSNVAINGVTCSGVTSVNVDLGITPATFGTDSNQYDTIAMVNEIAPVITVEGINPAWLSTSQDAFLGFDGKRTGNDTNIIYFRKRDPASTSAYLADNRIKVVATGMAHFDTLISGSGGSDAASTTMKLECIKSLGASPLTLTTGE